ncbi:MAG: metallophosphoesterase [Armatimonadetes bacterium]|nr:metallophosphoesterase [Armatimonadota bacterium]
MSRHGVTLPGLPPDLDGFRVVQLSDFHIGLFLRAKAVRRAVSLTNACEPDVVVLTGDFVNYRSLRFLPAGARELPALQSRLGVYACLGNHDHWEGVEKVRVALQEVGVRVLVNESLQITEGVCVAAVDDMMSGEPDLQATVHGIPKDAAVILLSHNPTILPQVTERPWLVLSGHTHGGQMALPFLGPRGMTRVRGIRWIMQKYESLGLRTHGGRPEAVCGHRYPAGWFQEGEARMYVNRGIGSNQVWPFRYNCPAEIACFTLAPSRG